MTILKRGLVQVYTGKGKGKTTAALGLAWRMLGAGGSVYVCQFLKPKNLATGEGDWAQSITQDAGQLQFDRLTIGWDMKLAESDAEQRNIMQRALAEKLSQIRQWARQGRWDLMILDEIVFCLHKNLVRREEVLGVMNERAAHVELVLTGRGADEYLIGHADLVTEMREVKHPFTQGISARRGIEY